MTIYIKNHLFHYEIENLCRLFFPNEKLTVIKDPVNILEEKSYIYTECKNKKDKQTLFVLVKLEGSVFQKECVVESQEENLERETERRFAVLLYQLLSGITRSIPPWGILTGVRPIKLMRRFTEEIGLEKTIFHFSKKFLVSDEKIALSVQTMKKEQEILDLSQKNSFSLYISIPFCPTRCSYCSFVSQSVKRAARLIPEYVSLLCEEIKHTGLIAKDLGLHLETVYVGGGTPTTLSPQQLEELFLAIKKNFEMDTCREFTVEAGRPDTITKEKLTVMKEAGVTRVSINPQTMNDKVLQEIGRKHTVQETIDSYVLTKKMEFDSINMDVIAGLPSDTANSFENTLTEICKLQPDSITVHTLCMKKASELTAEGQKLTRKAAEEASKMNRFAEKKLKEENYFPYYLYRQSRMVGNLENVGWAQKGKEGLYNVYVMDETHTVLACGAGAVSKLKDPQGTYLERIFNFKFPYEYMARFQEMMRRKEQVKEFYDKL